jgi:putative intracellular protease/amidase
MSLREPNPTRQDARKCIALVIANPAASTTTGGAVGFWWSKDVLREKGANFVQPGLWRSFAVRDGNLVAGQPTFSGDEMARRVIEALGR